MLFLPGPEALRTVVSSARIMNVSDVAKLRFSDWAVAWST